MELNERFVVSEHLRPNGTPEVQMDDSLWESFIDQSADAIGLFDRNGNILKVNKATETIFGYSKEELVGNKVITIPDVSYRHEVEHLQRKVLSGETVKNFETIRRRKDGSLIDVSITYSPITDDHGNIIAMANLLRDITSEKKALAALQESESKYRLIAENTADLIRILDLKGHITYASPSHELTLGRTPHYYERVRDFSFIHPHDLPVIGEQFQAMIHEDNPIHFEYRELHSDGHWIPLEAHCTPVMNHEGRINSIVMVVRDLTERKHTEELLRNSDKLAVIGQMAASIAHEIRNPLTSLKGFLQYFHSNSEEDQKGHYNLMLSELERINLIVSEFLLLAKPQVARFHKTSIRTLMEHILTLINTQAIEENVEVITEIEENLPEIDCDENQLKQAFLNYLKNAIEASASGDKICVRMYSDACHLIVEITDHGQGIPKETLTKIGMPFFTTKQKGTGLGLMISQKIIANHKGSVDISSEELAGTTVTIALPHNK